MKKAKQVYCTFLPALLLLILFVIWTIYNFATNKSFFKATLYDILTITAVVIFSYFFVKSHDKDIKKNEIFYDMVCAVEKSIDEIKNIILKKYIDRISLTQEIKRLKNTLYLISKISGSYDIEQEINSININLEHFENDVDKYLDQLPQDELYLSEEERKSLFVFCDNINFKSKMILSKVFF